MEVVEVVEKVEKEEKVERQDVNDAVEEDDEAEEGRAGWGGRVVRVFPSGGGAWVVAFEFGVDGGVDGDGVPQRGVHAAAACEAYSESRRSALQ